MKITLKTKLGTLVIAIALLITSIKTNAQIQISEQSFDLTKGATKGYYYCINMDKEKGSFDVVYKMGGLKYDVKLKNKYEHYTIDKDLKLVNGLLDLTTICIGIPSTFVVECALKKVPVVNICFDTNQSHAVMGSMISYWDAPFYKNARESFFANGVFNENDLSKVLEEVLLFDQDKVAVAAGEFLNREFGVLGDEVRTRTVNSIIG